jgi:hypothetical protein
MINVTLGEVKTPEEKPFPKLMIEDCSKDIFYFHRSGVGLPLQQPNRFLESLTWASAWDMDGFTDYNDPITIQNA